MSAWPSAASAAVALSGREGELVCVRISVEPKLLEELLDALAYVPFPINPEIFHGWPTVIEFPAYRSRLGEVKAVLSQRGIPTDSVRVNRMLDSILS